MEWKVSKVDKLVPENLAAGVTTQDPSEHIESASHSKPGLFEFPDEDPV